MVVVKEEYEKARALFEKSLEVKPGEKYPTRKIKDIDLMILSAEEEKEPDIVRAEEDMLAADSIIEDETSQEKLSRY